MSSLQVEKCSEGEKNMKKAVISLFFVGFLLGCAQQSSPESDIAQKIVADYYTALNNQDYQTMYGFISEGFKKIEPTAATYDDFEEYMSKFFDTMEGIEVTSTKMASVGSNEIVVDYVAVMKMKTGGTKELKSSFTVKKKPEGWRLIHPYGENIDTS